MTAIQRLLAEEDVAIRIFVAGASRVGLLGRQLQLMIGACDRADRD